MSSQEQRKGGWAITIIINLILYVREVFGMLIMESTLNAKAHSRQRGQLFSLHADLLCTQGESASEKNISHHLSITTILLQQTDWRSLKICRAESFPTSWERNNTVCIQTEIQTIVISCIRSWKQTLHKHYCCLITTLLCLQKATAACGHCR